ncbi:methionine gamma-lyase [bacterium BMS3Abin05]|nr:methionine gamma-lyase [bacterium BMS3Abin05]GBE26278.1 methionine gamma-lyase [bacterium BMS3Bbin03]HDK35379.1 aminotransferase class I/II-fold pyridoxal phosphate-dependent enzyme [Bacteroidota bacterium]HDZ12716.1 aminotransferase class I/II-fold pyridoxal phosphate-dependent enzyme [Bacteroidota bacterium]
MTPQELKKMSFATICVHGASGTDPQTGAVSFPIYQSSTFAFKSAKEGADIFAGKKEGYIYTRLGNPTQAAFEREIAFLEEADAALATASGMGAITIAILTMLKAGDKMLAAHTLYGGTHLLFKETLPSLGIKVESINPGDSNELVNHLEKGAKMVYIETPSNPTLQLLDIAEISQISHKYGALVIVDNTFATPYYQRPLQLGADIVIHSATKYIGGHGDTIAGVILGSKEFIDRSRNVINRDIGAAISPFNAWLLLRGLKTLPVRMERHSENAMRIAQYLNFHPKVSRVWYPGLRTHEQHELACRQMDGFGGMITFELKGGKKAGEILMNSVKLLTLAVSLGDVDSLIEQPATMTHSTYSPEELAAVGITEGMVRLSVGLEDVNDIIDDLSQALKKA